MSDDTIITETNSQELSTNIFIIHVSSHIFTRTSIQFTIISVGFFTR